MLCKIYLISVKNDLFSVQKNKQKINMFFLNITQILSRQNIPNKKLC